MCGNFTTGNFTTGNFTTGIFTTGKGCQENEECRYDKENCEYICHNPNSSKIMIWVAIAAVAGTIIIGLLVFFVVRHCKCKATTTINVEEQPDEEQPENIENEETCEASQSAENEEACDEEAHDEEAYDEEAYEEEEEYEEEAYDEEE